MRVMSTSLDVDGLRRASSSGGPWRSEDLLRVLVVNVVGLAAISVAIFQTTQVSGVGGRLGWLYLGLAGVAMSGAGNGAWLLQGRRTVGLASRRVLPDVPSSEPISPAEGDPTQLVDSGVAGEFIAVSNGSLYHVATCAFVCDREVAPASREEHQVHGRTPCGVCTP